MTPLAGLRSLLKRDPTLRFRYDAELGVARDLRGNLARVRGKGAGGVRSAGLRFIESRPELFGRVDTGALKLIRESQDPHGGWSVTLQQYLGAHRVFGGSVRLHMSDRGVLDSIGNRLFPDLSNVPRRPRVSAERAVRAAQRVTRCRTGPAQPPELLVVRHRGEPRLAWRVTLHDTRRGKRVPAIWIATVDALTGAVLKHYDNVQTAGPVTGAGTGYYSGAGPLNTWFNNVTYQLRDTTRTATGGPEIVTNDHDGASPSEDVDNDWNDVMPVGRDQHQGPEVDAHRYAGNVVDYFQAVHGRNSFDGAGGTLVTLVHFLDYHSGGYWDGTQVTLGDGSGDPFSGDDYETSDDWLAHEFTHAYTQYTCNLTYAGESGALNEAFSDVFAAFITGDWLVFEDSWIKTSAPAWRNMMDPTNGGQWDNSSDTAATASVEAGHCPSHYSDRYTGIQDNDGVHYNSGIINHLFYLLTVGGTHAISGISVTGIGQGAAERLLYHCMSDGLVGQPDATFLDFRAAMLGACLELFPTDLAMLSQVKNAFNAVGIGPDLFVRDNLADSGAEPYPGTYLWASPDIINRTAPVANPASAFANLADDTLWQNVEAGQPNYVYVRLQNRGSAAGDATVNVYFSAGTTFGTPSSWIHIGTLAETGIAPGTVRIAGPLIFPASLIPGVGHYCMIAVVSDVLDPAPDHSLISSVPDYLDYVRGTNNIAYRNMDVVDLVSGGSGTIQARMRGMPRMRDRFDLRIELGHFAPGATLRVRGPAAVLDAAIPRGLKLVAREKKQNVYEVLVGGARSRQLAFMGQREPGQGSAPGFNNVLIDREFTLSVDYVLPDGNARTLANGSRRKRGYVLSVRQLWHGSAVGAVGIRLVPGNRARRVRRAQVVVTKNG